MVLCVVVGVYAAMDVECTFVVGGLDVTRGLRDHLR